MLKFFRYDVWCVKILNAGVKKNEDRNHKNYQVKFCQNFLMDHNLVFQNYELCAH